MPNAPREPVDSEYLVPEHPKAIVERYRKIREHARRSDGQEKLTAKSLLAKMRTEYTGIREQVNKLDHADAVAKANEHVARAAASRAAAMHSAADGAPSAADQVAYWSGFIEETIAYIADHPNEPAPSAVAFVDTLNLGPEGRIFTSIKKMGARVAAAWADNQIAEQVATLRAMQRDLERGKLPAAVREKLAGKSGRSKRKPKAKRKAAPPSRKRKKSMADALLKKLEDECDVSVSESEDKDTGEELYEFELVIPKSLWAKVKASPDVLVGYMNALADEEEDTDEEPSDSGLGLDPDDPFPNDTDEETDDPDDADEEDED